MLSGLQVVFGRPNQVSSTARNGAGASGKEKSKQTNQGTHARTNTFDNRAVQAISQQKQ